jgi:hypothetical protein
MEAALLSTESDDSLLALVDFKWLMVGLGWRIDLTRLRRDAAYLGECVRLGLSSELPLLRQRSAELLDRHSAAAAAPAPMG